MKVAPIIHAIELSKKISHKLTYRLVHTGQHYDKAMSGDFFEQLKIPQPQVNLSVGSGSQAYQTAGIMVAYEKLLTEAPASLCLVVGDVTSTMACAIVAKKMNTPVAHVEAGIRSGDRTMPEEINRLVTDAITDYFFTTSEVANQNLRAAGIADNRIFFVGNTMIDTLLSNVERFRPPACWNDLGLQPQQYLVLTLHRPANVDRPEWFQKFLRALEIASRGVPVVFPVHPRTLKTLESVRKLPKSLHIIGPQPYLEFNYLVKNARAVITDSGGITEETTVLGVPCMTLRDSTERPETVTVGTNELLGTDPDAIIDALEILFSGRWKSGAVPEKWDGHAGERIVLELSRILES